MGPGSGGRGTPLGRAGWDCWASKDVARPPANATATQRRRNGVIGFSARMPGRRPDEVAVGSFGCPPAPEQISVKTRVRQALPPSVELPCPTRRLGRRQPRGPMHRIRGTFVALLATLTLASVAGAQTIAGTVRDTSGAVLPGVTVEASSAALIEKARSVV